MIAIWRWRYFCFKITFFWDEVPCTLADRWKCLYLFTKIWCHTPRYHNVYIGRRNGFRSNISSVFIYYLSEFVSPSKQQNIFHNLNIEIVDMEPTRDMDVRRTAMFLCLYEYSPVQVEALRQADRPPRDSYQVSINEIEKTREDLEHISLSFPERIIGACNIPVAALALTSVSL